MASATVLRPVGPSCSLLSKTTRPPLRARPILWDRPRKDSKPYLRFSASEWAILLRSGFDSLDSKDSLSQIPEDVLRYGLDAPRRHHLDDESRALAREVARLLHGNELKSEDERLTTYENEVKALWRLITPILQEEAKNALEVVEDRKNHLKTQIRSQGPWDEVHDPLPLTGVDALPMPVQISDKESLAPFFRFLSTDNGKENGDLRFGDASISDLETHYDVDVQVWEKGMLYADGRMDLCKKVLGPTNIQDLMQALSTNTSVKHFLLGNNIIGPVGAQAISDFCEKTPNRIETWYLAGNCIDAAGLERLVANWAHSKTVTNIWLKRNPLGPSSATTLSQLIHQTPYLRTLDLDQTNLGDGGVAALFSQISSLPSPAALRTIYLNGTGVSLAACESIAAFLASPLCLLESFYASLNPIGDAGAIALANGLRRNRSLKRLFLDSCGIKTAGATAIIEALTGNPTIFTVSLGQQYATDDLGMRYNYLEDGISDSLLALVNHTSSNLKFLNLGMTALSLPTFRFITKGVVALGSAISGDSGSSSSNSLVVFEANSIHGKLDRETKDALKAVLASNVAKQYNGMGYDEFDAKEARWLRSPRDVRLIDSGYRNHDTGLARRGKLVLKKHWEDGGKMIRQVMSAVEG